MTTEQNINAITEVLDKMGIDSTVMREELFGKINSGLPIFHIPYRHNFEGDIMEYDVQFGRDLYSGDYTAVNYAAVYKDKHIEIKEMMLNDIDLHLLDRELHTVDWEKFFADNAAALTSEEISKIDGILTAMEKLRIGKDSNGARVYLELQFKYFPEMAWHPFTKDFLRSRIQSEFVDITSDPSHQITSEYYKLSGKLNELYLALMPLELYMHLSSNQLMDKLLAHLAVSGPHVPFSLMLNNADGLFQLSIPLQDNSKKIKDSSYGVTHYDFNPLPDITISDVSIKELDTLFKGADWRSGYILPKCERNKRETFETRLAEIETKLEVLSASELGRSLAYRLQLTFWSGNQKYRSKIHPDAWKLLEKVPKQTASFPGYIPVYHALPVVSGDVFLLSYRPQFSKEFNKWPQIPVPVDDSRKKVYISFPDFVADNISSKHKFANYILVDDKNKSINKGKLLIVEEAYIIPVQGQQNKLRIEIPMLFNGSVVWDKSTNTVTENVRKMFGEGKAAKKKKSKGLKH